VTANRLGQRFRLVSAFLVVSLFFSVPGDRFAQETNPPQFSTHPKLHFRLQELFNEAPPSLPQETGLLRIDDQGRVQVYIRPVSGADVQDLLDNISLLGGKIDGQGLGVIQAWVPINVLESVADLPNVLYIRPPDYGQPNTGSVTTEGDVILASDDVRQQFGVTGAGVRVGVISDGLKGLEESIASGDLPSTTFHCQAASLTLRSNGCLVGETLVETSRGITGQPFRSDGNLAPGAEGTAMLEIVHDIAPGAELWFTNVATSMDWINAATFLAARVDVLVSDVAFPAFFPDGQNTLSQAVAQIIENPSNQAFAYIQSVGNHADKHYSATYTDSGIGNANGNVHLFSSTNETDGPATPLHLNQIVIPAETIAKIYLTWNDPAGASTNDYDLLLVDCETEVILDSSIEIQNGFQEPQETIAYINIFGVDILACYAIQNFGNFAAPRTLNILLDLRTDQPFHLFNTPTKSIVAPADTPGDLIAVGAVPHSSPTTIESFSSRGPTFDGRDKPDVVAPDGVRVTGAGGFPSAGCSPNCAFFGTSAAAPHVAGVTALLLELDPTLTLSSLKSVLKQSTNALGLIDGLATATAVTPLLAVSPTTTVDFGSVAVGQSADRTFTVTNSRGGTLNGTPSTSAPFSILGNAAYSLTSGESKDITVRFSPTSVATFMGNATFTGSLETRQLTGVGIRAFTDDPLVTGATAIKRVHITELRDAANQLRVQGGLVGFSFTDPTLTSGVTTVKRVHITELRAALTQAAAALGKAAPTFATDPAIVAGQTVIKAAHINEIRTAIKSLETVSTQ